MDDSTRVRVRERAGEREADLERLLVAELVLGDQARERGALDEL